MTAIQTTRVIHGNCLDIIPTLDRKFDLVFADPPFNIDMNYRGFIDCWDSVHKYNEFVRDFTTLCYDKCQGILALHGNDYLCEQYLTIAAFRAYCRISWCNWYYAFGQCTRENWIDSRCHLLLYTNVPEYTWNPESVLVDSARVGYGDNRIFETENGGKRLPGTVWGIGETYFGRIQGNNKERREKHPNQLPELYLARIIKAYTNEGDWILDPFGGSGTTAVVAQALGRNCVTIEISEESCVSIRERLEKGAVRC